MPTVTPEDKGKTLTKELRRQLKYEIHDDEELLTALQTKVPNARLLALQQKFGLVALPSIQSIAANAKGARR